MYFISIIDNLIVRFWFPYAMNWATFICFTESVTTCTGCLTIVNYQLYQFWTPGLPDRVHSNRPCPSVSPSVSLSLKISQTAHWFFLIFGMKLGHHKGTKVTGPDIWKKSLGVRNGGEPHFWGIFDFFCPYLKKGSNDFNEILRLNSPHRYNT